MDDTISAVVGPGSNGIVRQRVRAGASRGGQRAQLAIQVGVVRAVIYHLNARGKDDDVVRITGNTFDYRT